MFVDQIGDRDQLNFDPNFKPTFFEDIEKNITRVDRDRCNNNTLCLFDSIVSGLQQMGDDTLFSIKKTVDKKIELG